MLVNLLPSTSTSDKKKKKRRSKGIGKSAFRSSQQPVCGNRSNRIKKQGRRNDKLHQGPIDVGCYETRETREQMKMKEEEKTKEEEEEEEEERVRSRNSLFGFCVDDSFIT